MNKQYILDEIARTASENGGLPLGRARFEQDTGITQTDWFGKYWARWGDAVKEAGFVPNERNGRMDETVLIEALVGLVRELGHFPVAAELRVKGGELAAFPSHNTFRRLGTKCEQIQKLFAYCATRPDLEDVRSVVAGVASQGAPDGIENEIAPEPAMGYVYLLKATRFYKIGRSSSFERRSRQLAIQLPERADTVHVIRTDDPVGIELYWHRRFEAKRKNGEWFELNAQDIKAFKRRKFM